MNKHLDVVFINIGNTSKSYQTLINEFAAIEPPIWALMLAASAQKHGLSVDIIDGDAERLSPQEIATRIKTLKPTLTVVVVYGHNPSASTQLIPSAQEVCNAICNQTPDQDVLLVGGHIAALPIKSLEEIQATYACGGEGFATIPALVKALQSKKKKTNDVPDLYSNTPQGYMILPNAKKRAPLADINKEITDLPWYLLPMQNYKAHNWHCFANPDNRQPYGTLYTSLGCPYNCYFCCIQAPFRSGERVSNYKSSSYRLFDPEYVLSQIDTLVTEYGVSNIKIADELFLCNREHVKAICDGIIDRNYDLNMWIYARSNVICNTDLLPLMKKAGMNWFGIGIESGNSKILESISKKTKVDTSREAAHKLRNEGIYMATSWIFGLPEDTHDSMEDTLSLAHELNTEFVNFHCAAAYPGSKLYIEAKEKGWPLPKTWGGYAQFSKDFIPLPTKYLDGLEVLKFRDAAWQEYYSENNTAYRAMMKTTFGPHIIDHLNRMTKIKLERTYLNDSQHDPTGTVHSKLTN